MQTMVYATGGVMTGAGTAADPYLVADYADLKAVGIGTTYTRSSVYRVIGDIDASPSATENGGAGFVPIGTASSNFIGVFHGAGHIIRHLTINRPSLSGVGLFGFLDFCTIDSVGLIDNTITGSSYVGGIAGCNPRYTTYSSIISYCYNTGSVNGSTNVGGIVGYNESGNNISYCYNTGSVNGSTNVGGIVGYNESGNNISSCYNTGNVTGGSSTGGIVGRNESGNNISSCYNTGNVTGGSQSGGIVGYNFRGNTISYSFNTGYVFCYGGTNVGGIAGINFSTNNAISYCYNTGDVEADDYIGGIIGYSNLGGTTVSYCYNASRITYWSRTGAIAGGNSYDTINYCYWDTLTSGQHRACGVSVVATAVIGLNTAKMKNSSNLINFDFDSTWRIRADSTYPGLQALDNAPFAFSDTLATNRTFSLLSLLSNDCDVETARKPLILRVVRVGSGTTDSVSTFVFPASAVQGDTELICYRVGEIRTTDTLWGNMVWSFLILDTNMLTQVKPRSEFVTPYVFSLSVFSNFFSRSAAFSFTLPSNASVSLKIYDLRGREVATLVNSEQLSAGSYSRQWNTRTSSSGLYFCHLRVGSSTLTRKIWR
jgi:hypothetical protein